MSEQVVGPRAVDRIRRRSTFRELRRPSGRARRGPVQVAFVPRPEATVPEVGYAVSRRCGNAVVRNRLRRRLRAAAEGTAATLPPGAYLVTVRPDAVEFPYHELASAVAGAMSASADSGLGVRKPA